MDLASGVAALAPLAAELTGELGEEDIALGAGDLAPAALEVKTRLETGLGGDEDSGIRLLGLANAARPVQVISLAK